MECQSVFCFACFSCLIRLLTILANLTSSLVYQPGCSFASLIIFFAAFLSFKVIVCKYPIDYLSTFFRGIVEPMQLRDWNYSYFHSIHNTYQHSYPNLIHQVDHLDYQVDTNEM